MTDNKKTINVMAASLDELTKHQKLEFFHSFDEFLKKGILDRLKSFQFNQLQSGKWIIDYFNNYYINYMSGLIENILIRYYFDFGKKDNPELAALEYYEKSLSLLQKEMIKNTEYVIHMVDGNKSEIIENIIERYKTIHKADK